MCTVVKHGTCTLCKEVIYCSGGIETCYMFGGTGDILLRIVLITRYVCDVSQKIEYVNKLFFSSQDWINQMIVRVICVGYVSECFPISVELVVYVQVYLYFNRYHLSLIGLLSNEVTICDTIYVISYSMDREYIAICVLSVAHIITNWG